MKDTPPEINERLFAAMMRKTDEERLHIGFSMMATGRKLVWDSLAHLTTERERRAAFLDRMYGM